jgi:uncharacterized membrane protein YidH (DUF202 family)
MSQPPEEESPSSPGHGKPGTDLGTNLAVMRTQFALERTQLAWVRTGFTLITAGFAIDKVAEALHRDRVLQGTNWVQGSHVTGLVLIGSSTLFLGVATFSYLREARRLARLVGNKPPVIPAVLPMTLLVLVLGVVLLILIHTTD